ncbi:hypothetical protein, partial [Streptomyces mirabilis]|uniref:hypothetical protein n=1 Tax=Streptomyces mirabilis TaxID=68239 RepID=UPI0036567ECA
MMLVLPEVRLSVVPRGLRAVVQRVRGGGGRRKEEEEAGEPDKTRPRKRKVKEAHTDSEKQEQPET